MYDPGLKYELSVAINEAGIARNPEHLHAARRRLRDDLADYPGLLLWREELYGGLRVITATKYPPELAPRIIEKLQARALGGDDERGAARPRPTAPPPRTKARWHLGERHRAKP